MPYGVKSEGMSEADWLVECQGRHVVREMRKLSSVEARRALLQEWQTKLPGVTDEMVRRIWKNRDDQ